MASKGRGARTKGSTYERNICKKLTALTGSTFSRTAYSGATHQDIVSASFVGDIYTEHDSVYSNFNYELKNHDNTNLNNIVSGNGELPLFLQQVIQDTKRLGDTTLPCLIIHIKRWKDLVLIPYESDTFRQIASTDKMIFHNVLSYKDDRLGTTYRYSFMVMELETFATLNKDILVPYINHAFSDFNSFNKNVNITFKNTKVEDVVSTINEIDKGV